MSHHELLMKANKANAVAHMKMDQVGALFKYTEAMIDIINLVKEKQEGQTEDFQRGWNFAMETIRVAIEKRLQWNQN